MSIKLKKLFMCIREVHTHLRVLHIDNVFFLRMSVHCRYDLIVVVLAGCLSHLGLALFVQADVIEPYLILPPQHAFVLEYPTSTPCLLHLQNGFILCEIPYSYLRILHQHQKPIAEETATGHLLADRKEMLEAAIAVDLQVTVIALDKEGIAQLQLKGFLIGICDGSVSLCLDNVIPII